MEELVFDIVAQLKAHGTLDDAALSKIIHAHNRGLTDNDTHISKRKLLPFLRKMKENSPEVWERLDLDEAYEKALFDLLRMKPRRSASGVATVTVITKPWTCSGNCIYCPCDVRMPKSYLADEPACQRAERNYFDPYLQLASRLRALGDMGHPTDKIELIVLGGTWNDYPEAYRIWFVSGLFSALNDDDETRERKAGELRAYYRDNGLESRPEYIEARTRDVQEEVERGLLSFNEAIERLYFEDEHWSVLGTTQTATLEDLSVLQRKNEIADRRCVGLVVETRPDTITAASLELLRRLGCTKVQMGVQSCDPAVLAANGRAMTMEVLENAFALVRAFGFKLHTHFMLNLLTATPASDETDYRVFVSDPRFLPDEVKLYPCSLVHGTRLVASYEAGSWRPYTEEELIGVLDADVCATPPYVRISRMIRDISSTDILCGNKKANLRQLVDAHIASRGEQPLEIRCREVAGESLDADALVLNEYVYHPQTADEHFLSWVSPDGHIAGFLRLSLPHASYLASHPELPIRPNEAMIREVHIYGRAARIAGSGENAQHLGLGRRAIERACGIASDAGFTDIAVISAVGTRAYYRRLGFVDGDLYQYKAL